MKATDLPDNSKNLYDLDDLTDYQVADDYSDPRGWDVLDADHRVIGKVDHLLVNRNTERVSFIDVEIDPALTGEGISPYQAPVSAGVHEFLTGEGENHLILPIAMARLDVVRKKVTTMQLNHTDFTGTGQL